jgi:hypothetical protein
MKAEDKFYFGKPGQPERFAIPSNAADIKIKDIQGANASELDQLEKMLRPAASAGDAKAKRYIQMIKQERQWLREGMSGHPRWSDRMSRPGQPERFDMEGACWEGYEPVGTKQKDGKTVPNCVPMKNAAGGQEKFSGVDTIAAYVQVLYEEFGTARGKQAAQEMMRAAQSIGGNAGAALQKAIRTASTSKNVSERNRAIGDIEDYLMREGFSRLGQPEKFDASSLDRGSFAEASTSPMLGKLLAAKVMPEGGWRAVQAGSDTLVVSFEDADLARDFGRRVATKGYNATSPVQSIGRYWNVEVKNG